MNNNIPLLDLSAQYQSIKPDIDRAIAAVIERSAFVGGEEVTAFEKEFADYCAQPSSDIRGASDAPSLPLYCASVGNGTDAITLALRALGIGPGDEVITVANTFIATAEAITLNGAKPVFVDILQDTMLIDPAAIEAAITPKTKAIIAVHLYGQCCDMDAINAIAHKHNLKVIEDAAQAHGARWRGHRAGTLGHAACFSFYPGKNLGAYGDGGAVVSKDADLINKIRMIANHGRVEKYTHEIEGTNSRLDGLQAAILRVKLQHLDAWNAARQRIARQFNMTLAGRDFILPSVNPHAEPVWHLYVIRVADREKNQAHFKMRGISTGVHYPIPLHLQPAYAYLGMKKGSLPATEAAAPRLLSLPIYPEMTRQQIAAVTDTFPVSARLAA